MTAMQATGPDHGLLPGETLDLALLRQGVEEANIPALLLCLVQLTDDPRWMQDPFVPRRGRGLDDNDSGGLSDDVQRTIRDAAYGLVARYRRRLPGQAWCALPPSGADLNDRILG